MKAATVLPVFAQAKAVIRGSYVVGDQLMVDYEGSTLPVGIHESHAGFYIGTWDEGGPCERISAQYWRAKKDAIKAFLTGAFALRVYDPSFGISRG